MKAASILKEKQKMGGDILPCGHLSRSAHSEVWSTLFANVVCQGERFLRLMPNNITATPFFPSAYNKQRVV